MVGFSSISEFPIQNMTHICQTYFFLILGIHYVHTVAGIDKDGYCSLRNVTIKSTNGTGTSQKQYCCTHYEELDNKCKACNVGFTSKKGQRCYKCAAGMYGVRCAFSCKCEGSQRCDHVIGCTADDKTFKAGMKKEGQKPKDVVIFMSCIAAFGLLLVAAFSVWKYRQTLLRLISSLRSRQPSFGEHRMAQRFRITSVGNDRSTKLGLETIYAVINEKEMLSYCEIENSF